MGEGNEFPRIKAQLCGVEWTCPLDTAGGVRGGGGMCPGRLFAYALPICTGVGLSESDEYGTGISVGFAVADDDACGGVCGGGSDSGGTGVGGGVDVAGGGGAGVAVAVVPV